MNTDILRQAKILIVDDEVGNIRLVRDILRIHGYANVHSTTDSREAYGMVEELQPDLLLLDLHMPHLDGLGVMQQLHSGQAPDVFLPILVVSGDYSQEVKLEALASGAKDFLPRPFDAIEIQLRIANLLEARFLQIQLKQHNEELEARIYERTSELDQAHLEVKEAQMEIISRLAVAGELHDNDTGDHTRRVSLIASLIAQSLKLPPEQVELLRQAAPLHDVGKIGVSDPILLKQGPLTREEFESMKEHCRIGAQVLSGGSAELVKMAEVIALNHHERFDGSGYPQGLRGDEIPLMARILSVADVFDALTHERPYKAAWPVQDAIAEIQSQSGRQFDPQVVEAFMPLPHQELL